VFKDGRPVERTRYCVYPGEEAAATERLAGPRHRLDARRGFLGLNRPYGNYFHILTQIIPAIASYRADPGFAEGMILLGDTGPTVPATLPIIRRALALAGIGSPRLALFKALPPVEVADLTFSSLLTGCDGVSALRRDLYGGMAARARAPDGAAFPPIIYIARVDGRSRPLRNEEALVRRLLPLGVVPVVLSLLGLDEQIMLFRHARLVIGPHGAGLANIVFAQVGTVLYDLFPDHYINPCMNHLAQQHGVHYWCDVHPAADQPGVWRHQIPWSVDIDAVERRVGEIMAHYGIDPSATAVTHPS
jgi:capsular polysaccharide biosynthesis protein